MLEYLAQLKPEVAGIEIPALLIAAGVFFVFLQLMLVLRHLIRCAAMNSVIARLNQAESREFMQILTTVRGRKFRWARWIARGVSPKNGTPTSIIDRLDDELNESVTLLSRLGELAPLLGLLVSTIAFVFFAAKPPTETTNLREIFLTVAPMVEGLALGAFLGFGNRLFEHVCDSKSRNTKRLALQWYDEKVHPHLSAREVNNSNSTRRLGKAIDTLTKDLTSVSAALKEAVCGLAIQTNTLTEIVAANSAVLAANHKLVQDTLATSAEAIQEKSEALAESLHNTSTNINAASEVFGTSTFKFASLASDSAERISELFAVTQKFSCLVDETLTPTIGEFSTSSRELNKSANVLTLASLQVAGAAEAITATVSNELIPSNQLLHEATERIAISSGDLSASASSLKAFCSEAESRIRGFVGDLTTSGAALTRALGEFQSDVLERLKTGIQSYEDIASDTKSQVGEFSTAISSFSLISTEVRDSILQHQQAAQILARSVEKDVIPANREVREAVESLNLSTNTLQSGILRFAEQKNSLLQDIENLFPALAGALQPLAPAVDRLTNSLDIYRENATQLLETGTQFRSITENFQSGYEVLSNVVGDQMRLQNGTRQVEIAIAEAVAQLRTGTNKLRQLGESDETLRSSITATTFGLQAAVERLGTVLADVQPAASELAHLRDAIEEIDGRLASLTFVPDLADDAERLSKSLRRITSSLEKSDSRNWFQRWFGKTKV